MNVVDLDGNISHWHLTGHVSKGKMLNKSELHLRTRNLLVSTFPTLQILEEVPINPKKNETLYLDFYLPLTKTCIEVHGEQHYKFIKFYHNNLLSYIKAQKRDQSKKDWCLINNIKYIEFPFNETNEEWLKRLNNDQNS